MPKHLQREIESLKKKLMSLAALVEEQVVSAVRSVEKRDTATAGRVIEFDRKIDLFEIEIEEECLKLLALHQPVAIDLRFIVAVLKINNDLERVADLASNIADRAILLAAEPSFFSDGKLSLMCGKVSEMLKKCLDSLFKLDAPIAREVCMADDEVDALNRRMVDEVKRGILVTPDRTETFLLLLSVAHNLERIADHATNIAEDVIYMIEGDIVRHRVS